MDFSDRKCEDGLGTKKSVSYYLVINNTTSELVFYRVHHQALQQSFFSFLLAEFTACVTNFRRMSGSVISHQRTSISAGDCRAACDETPACAAWSFNRMMKEEHKCGCWLHGEGATRAVDGRFWSAGLKNCQD